MSPLGSLGHGTKAGNLLLPLALTLAVIRRSLRYHMGLKGLVGVLQLPGNGFRFTCVFGGQASSLSHTITRWIPRQFGAKVTATPFMRKIGAVAEEIRVRHLQLVASKGFGGREGVPQPPDPVTPSRRNLLHHQPRSLQVRVLRAVAAGLFQTLILVLVLVGGRRALGCRGGQA